VVVCARIPFGKQPVVERASGTIVGYTGVDYIDFEGQTWLEWGYRLTPESRGRGYATEASQALLARARLVYQGELLAVIHPDNLASQNVGRKLGFRFWKQAPVEGDLRNLYRLRLPDGADAQDAADDAGDGGRRSRCAWWTGYGPRRSSSVAAVPAASGPTARSSAGRSGQSAPLR
jgi:GNAT superfamily N-acetyltransferase